LANHDQQDGASVHTSYDRFLETIAETSATFGSLTPAIDHFRKVTASYRSGLFACYAVPDLPRTNNDLEHLFGATRYHERRATGRKVANPSLVLRGSVRIVAAVVTQGRSFVGADLRPTDLRRWQSLRATLETRHEARRVQRRFRRDPVAYLTALENLLLKQVLPA
jgi:hypothetical protein